MAIQEVMVDDLDGTPIGEGEGGTVLFAFEGSSYKIDLTREHRDELAALLATYISKGQAVEDQPEPGEPNQLDAEEAKRLALEELDRAKAGDLQAEAQRRIAEGKLPYEIHEARRWLDERGIAYNQMGPLKEEFRVQYEQHFGLPSYTEAKQAQKKR